MPKPAVSTYVLLTDAPPLGEGGHGCSVLTKNWLDAFGSAVKLVVTRQMHSSVVPSNVVAGLSTPTLFYPDLTALRCPRQFRVIKSMLEIIILFFRIGKITRAIHSSAGERLFAFFGGNPWFLYVAYLVAKKSGLPLDVYLVDDLEESVKLEKQGCVARMVRWLEPKVLTRAERVFVISPGYVEHLRAKYGVESKWLPIPFTSHALTYSKYSTEAPDIRQIAYLGAVNTLYISAIKDILAAVESWNAGNVPFKLKFVLMTYTNPGYVKRVLSGFSNWELLSQRPDKECEERMKLSWAIFLPYSFDKEEKVMVSTSFPSRLARCMVVGRPLLVYGPSYASLPRYFRENSLDLCVENRSDLEAAFQRIEQVDSPALIEKYGAALHRFHRQEAIRSCLAAETACL